MPSQGTATHHECSQKWGPMIRAPLYTLQYIWRPKLGQLIISNTVGSLKPSCTKFRGSLSRPTRVLSVIPVTGAPFLHGKATTPKHHRSLDPHWQSPTPPLNQPIHWPPGPKTVTFEYIRFRRLKNSNSLA